MTSFYLIRIPLLIMRILATSQEILLFLRFITGGISRTLKHNYMYPIVITIFNLLTKIWARGHCFATFFLHIANNQAITCRS